MSFWKKLFGIGRDDGDGTAKVAREAEHNGFRIAAMPYPEAGQFQVAGTISKQVGDVVREHRFVRADRFGTIDEAAEFSIMKARQIIDQQGERIFD
ncbi:MAG: HlyU family transcriptional regulator [Hyphomicrobiaceae bacterium]